MSPLLSRVVSFSSAKLSRRAAGAAAGFSMERGDDVVVPEEALEALSASMASSVADD